MTSSPLIPPATICQDGIFDDPYVAFPLCPRLAIVQEATSSFLCCLPLDEGKLSTSDVPEFQCAHFAAIFCSASGKVVYICPLLVLGLSKERAVMFSVSVLSERGTWRGGEELRLHKVSVEREGIALSAA